MSVSLPLEAESLRCSDFARVNAVDPGGTALAPDIVVLVEVAEPWPKPAGKHPDLVELVRRAADHHEQVRLLATVPHDPDRRRILGFRRTVGGMLRTEVPVGSQPVDDLGRVLRGDDGITVSGPSTTRTVLVCTQGSHDVCCGSDGVELADRLASHPDVELFRVSHTGGHRFSPTAMTLPDGRMWAYLTEQRVRAILDRSLAPDVAADVCRGWWGAAAGPAQIAERVLFSHMGWALDDTERAVDVEALDDGTHRATVVTDVGSWSVMIAAGRSIPSIACEKPGGQPVKDAQEWTVVGGPDRVD